jgi:hypothetical protein
MQSKYRFQLGENMSCEAYIALVEVESAMARLMAAVLNEKLPYMQRNDNACLSWCHKIGWLAGMVAWRGLSPIT